MSEFDPELYLRALGEQTMTDVEVSDLDRTLVDRSLVELGQAAAALIVGGVIDEQRAGEIASEFARAVALARESAGGAVFLHAGRHHWADADLVDLCARRAFTPGAVLTLAIGVLRVGAVTISDERTSVEGSLVTPVTSAAPQNGMPSLQLSAGGTPVPTRFSGNTFRSADDETRTIEGVWECDPLAMAADWLEIDGCRLALDAQAPRPDFEVEEFSTEDRLRRYLWLLVCGWGHDFGLDAVEPALRALQAAGLIDGTDARSLALTWVANRDALPEPASTALTPPASGLAPTLEAGRDRRRPAVLHRVGPGREYGGVVGLGAVSPRFDGVMVAIDSLSVRRRGVSAEVEVSGATPPSRLPGFGVLGLKPVSWWLSDEHEHRYVGEITSSSSAGNHTRGRISFPALQGEPNRLNLTVATPGAAATIAVPLEWT